MRLDDALLDWVGRERTWIDRLSVSDVARMAATLNRETTPTAVPMAWHWGALIDPVRQSRLGPDGHPLRGDFLPPIPLPRRMFAGADIWVKRPLRAGVMTTTTERIASLTSKTGRSGPLAFLTVERTLSQAGRVAVQEVQTLVYRDPPSDPGAAEAKGEPASQVPEWRCEVRPDPVLLFRFSAATFNSHRIHYDRPYAAEVEGYPDLVVQGPLIALLLLEAFHDRHPGAQPARFRFRAQRPLFANGAFFVCGISRTDGAQLWAESADGQIAMTAEVALAPA